MTVWYPSEENPSEGVFIRRHALSLVSHARVSVLVPKSKESAARPLRLETEEDSGILECRATYRRSSLPALSFAINAFRFLKSCILALREAESALGEARMFFFHRLSITAPFAAYVSFVLKKPFVAVEHFSGLALDENGKRSPQDLLYRILARRACRLVTVSEFLKTRMLERGIMARYEVVPNIVEVKEPAPNTKERSKKTILYVGAFRKVKNLPLLVEAVRLLAEKRRDFRVIVVGDGEERERIVGMVKSLGLEPFFEFRGRLVPEEVQRLYSEADVLAVTSRIETFSLAAAEAIAHGVPVVTTPCGGPEEFVREGNGMVLRSFSAEELAEALEQVLDGKIRFNPERLARYARERFSYQAVGRKLHEIALACLNDPLQRT